MKRQKWKSTLMLVSVITLLSVPKVVCAQELEINEEEECCPFCDSDELTIAQKYEELIVKALIDTDNMLDDGEITKEEHKLQTKPLKERLMHIESATEQEILDGYGWILTFFFDQTTEDEKDGIKIDPEFLQYINEQIEQYNVKM